MPFLNEYWELESEETASWTEALGVSASGPLGAGGVIDCNFIINFSLLFLVFHGVGGVGDEFAISQRIWVIGVSGSSILGGSIAIISSGCVRGNSNVNCNFIINFLFFIFLVFHGVGGVAGNLEFLNEYG